MKNNNSQFVGVNGNKLFILCKLVLVRDGEVERKRQQMAAVEKLPIGSKFWTRVDGKTDPDSAYPMDDYGCFYEITFVGIRDRLKKEKTRQTKSVAKVMGMRQNPSSQRAKCGVSTSHLGYM
jgi:hypothetical protein